MSFKLFIQAIIKFLLGLVIVGALIFGPAGTFNYLQAWLLIGALFIPMFIAGIIMMIKNPDLLKKRLNAKEKQNEQKLVLVLCALMFVSAFVMAGLNHRFGWINMPLWVSYIALGLFLISYLLYGEVSRENVYLARTVEVQENQKLIDTGLYGIVRHPMYMATLVLFLSMPIILGSIISFAIMMFYIPIIAFRIKNEEKVLEEGLEGYSEYKKRVKYKVIPFIW